MTSTGSRRAERLDLEHGTQFMPTARVEGSDDPDITLNSDIVVITAGAKQKPGGVPDGPGRVDGGFDEEGHSTHR